MPERQAGSAGKDGKMGKGCGTLAGNEHLSRPLHVQHSRAQRCPGVRHLPFLEACLMKACIISICWMLQCSNMGARHPQVHPEVRFVYFLPIKLAFRCFRSCLASVSNLTTFSSSNCQYIVSLPEGLLGDLAYSVNSCCGPLAGMRRKSFVASLI